MNRCARGGGCCRNRVVLHIFLMLWLPSNFETGLLGLMPAFPRMNEIRVRAVVFPSIYIHKNGSHNIHKCEVQSPENCFLAVTYDGRKIVTCPEFRE